MDMNRDELFPMVADYMEKGFLDNIIDMFKHDASLFGFVGELMSDERGRVRLGTTALIETHRKEFYVKIIKAIPSIAENLKSPNPTIRGDSAYLLGIIGHKDALDYLKPAFEKEEGILKELIGESIVEIKGHGLF